MKKIVVILLSILIAVALAFGGYFLVGQAPVQKNITWGVNFSQMQAEVLKLDWKKTYLALMEDLGVKNIKLLTQWDWVEGQQDDFYFKDIDWQIKEAKARGVKITYVVGMKTGRWPECHLPAWAAGLSRADQQTQILQYIEKVVTRYKNSTAIVAWQAENEPLFQFGQCPWRDKDFLKKEVALIKSLDSARPVIVSDSGEQSSWFAVAKIGDTVGVTMYRKVWVHIVGDIGFYTSFPIPPVFYWRKAQLVNYFFDKPVICGELQAEPWAPKLFYDVSLAEQEKTMNLQQFKDNISYARQTGLDTFYFWGSEWWYWLKTTQNKPEIWNEAQKLFID